MPRSLKQPVARNLHLLSSHYALPVRHVSQSRLASPRMHLRLHKSPHTVLRSGSAVAKIGAGLTPSFFRCPLGDKRYLHELERGPSAFARFPARTSEGGSAGHFCCRNSALATGGQTQNNLSWASEGARASRRFTTRRVAEPAASDARFASGHKRVLGDLSEPLGEPLERALSENLASKTASCLFWSAAQTASARSRIPSP
jgi:hypothetical protein